MSEFLDNEFAEKMATDLGLKVEVTFVPWAQYWEQKISCWPQMNRSIYIGTVSRIFLPSSTRNKPWYWMI